MSRCLSDKTLLKGLAELDSASERRHVDGCPACASRRRELQGDVTTIVRVLATTPEPRMRRTRATRRWVPAAVLSTLAAGALLLIEVAAWKAIQSVSEPERTREVAVALADLSSSLFSINGEPDRVLAEAQVGALDQDDSICDGLEAECADAEASTDPAEMEGILDGASSLDYASQGG